MRFFLVLCTLLTVAGAAAAQERDPPARDSAPATGDADAPAGFRYTVRLSVEPEVPELEDLLRDSSTLLDRIDAPPPSRAGLRHRMAGDVERFRRAARSLGYYDAEFSTDVEPPASPEAPATAVVTVTPGPLYSIDAIAIRSAGPRSPAAGLSVPVEAIGLAEGQPARATSVIDAESAILRSLQERGYPMARAEDREVVVDVDAKTMDVVYRIDHGPQMRFGPVQVAGAETIDPIFILRRLPWRYGTVSDIRLIDKGRRNLLATGLFSRVGIEFSGDPDADGLAPVTVTVTEREQRTIGAGLSASTSEGLGASAFWVHRNLFGGAEIWNNTAEISEIQTGLRSELTFPDVLANDQDLSLEASFFEKSTDAFDGTTYKTGLTLDRRISDILSVDYGLSFERSRFDEDGIESQFTLVGIPLGVTRDTSNDLLHPTRGGRLRLTLTPYLETLGSTLSFYRAQGRYSHYLALDSEARYVLAGRVGIGSAVGASTANLPADKRFYSGGSGTVRGYRFQSVGPLDDADKPLGGKSLLDFGIEARLRVTETIGIVPFLDGGQVYDSATIDLTEDMRWGAGLGLRYHTPIGPVRVDFAVPINRRDSDDRFQLYFSLGQAF